MSIFIVIFVVGVIGALVYGHWPEIKTYAHHYFIGAREWLYR